MQHAFCYVNVIGRSWRTWKSKWMTPEYFECVFHILLHEVGAERKWFEATLSPTIVLVVDFCILWEIRAHFHVEGVQIFVISGTYSEYQNRWRRCQNLDKSLVGVLASDHRQIFQQERLATRYWFRCHVHTYSPNPDLKSFSIYWNPRYEIST